MNSEKKGLSQPVLIFFAVLAAVVIAIPIGLFATGFLGSWAILRASKDVDVDKYKEGKLIVQMLVGGVDVYTLDNGSPPVSLENLVTKPSNAPKWQGPYIKASNLKDPFGHSFQYKAPGEHGDFDIVFLGKDGQSGGDGVNADYGNWQ